MSRDGTLHFKPSCGSALSGTRAVSAAVRSKNLHPGPNAEQTASLLGFDRLERVLGTVLHPLWLSRPLLPWDRGAMAGAGFITTYLWGFNFSGLPGFGAETLG